MFDREFFSPLQKFFPNSRNNRLANRVFIWPHPFPRLHKGFCTGSDQFSSAT